jgi:hypothetical protein
VENPLLSVPDFLKRITYKPGWKIKIVEHHDAIGTFDVRVIYDGYESKNAAFDPICFEERQVTKAREVWSRSIGKSVRHENKFCFRRTFCRYDLEHMRPEDIIRYVIGDTIKQAEMYEFERWFKFDGVPIFEHREELKDGTGTGRNS